MPDDTRTIITETENTTAEEAQIVPNENWLIKNNLLCSCGQNKRGTKIELKNVGPVPRIVHTGTKLAKLEKETAISQVFAIRQSEDNNGIHGRNKPH